MAVAVRWRCGGGGPQHTARASRALFPRERCETRPKVGSRLRTVSGASR